MYAGVLSITIEGQEMVLVFESSLRPRQAQLQHAALAFEFIGNRTRHTTRHMRACVSCGCVPCAMRMRMCRCADIDIDIGIRTL